MPPRAEPPATMRMARAGATPLSIRAATSAWRTRMRAAIRNTVPTSIMTRPLTTLAFNASAFSPSSTRARRISVWIRSALRPRASVTRATTPGSFGCVHAGLLDVDAADIGLIGARTGRVRRGADARLDDAGERKAHDGRAGQQRERLALAEVGGDRQQLAGRLVAQVVGQAGRCAGRSSARSRRRQATGPAANRRAWRRSCPSADTAAAPLSADRPASSSALPVSAVFISETAAPRSGFAPLVASSGWGVLQSVGHRALLPRRSLPRRNAVMVARRQRAPDGFRSSTYRFAGPYRANGVGDIEPWRTHPAMGSCMTSPRPAGDHAATSNRAVHRCCVAARRRHRCMRD